MTATKPFCLVKSSINIDETFLVPHIVKPGETISSSGLVSRPGGKGANVSAAIALAGASVTLSGAVGKDATWPVEELKQRHVDTSSIEVLDDTPTGRAFIQIARDGENSIVLLKGANYARQSKSSDPAHAWETAEHEVTHLVLQNEIPLETTTAFLTFAKEQSKSHVTTFFNPSPMLSSEEVQRFPWNLVDVLIVNEGEGLDLLSALDSKLLAQPRYTSDQNEDTRSSRVLEDLSSLSAFQHTAWLVLTRGGKGVMAHVQLANSESQTFSVPPVKPKQIKDTTGAGDTFAGNLVAALMGHNVASNDQLLLLSAKPKDAHFAKEALQWASRAASLACETEGAMQSIPSAKQVKSRA